MTKVQTAVLIDAPVSSIWDVLTDPDYIPKLYPDAISVEATPLGRSVVGQNYKITGKAGRRKILIYATLVELVPESRLVTRNAPGGLFKTFEQTVQINPKAGKVEVSLVYEYELSAGYVGKILNDILIERLVKDNIRGYGTNLKLICELLPIAR